LNTVEYVKNVVEELLEPKINARTLHVYYTAPSTPCRPQVLLPQFPTYLKAPNPVIVLFLKCWLWDMAYQTFVQNPYFGKLIYRTAFYTQQLLNDVEHDKNYQS
jgi:hypothetical protein